jgi:hypothetical protein
MLPQPAMVWLLTWATLLHNARHQGFLIPSFHKSYWMGLRKPGATEPFAWFDPYATPLTNSSAYSHWGEFVSAGLNNSEPNNLRPPENCAAANWTSAYDNSWGWADTRCTFNFTYICKVIRKQPKLSQAWRSHALSCAVARFHR